jgi:hypothetical protein
MPESTDYTKITVYRSNTPGAKPTTATLAEGEIAVNLSDRKIYSRNNNDEIVELSGGNEHNHTTEDITDIESYVDNKLNIALRPDVTTVTGTTYTIQGSDETNLIRFTSADAVTITVPADADAGLPVGFIAHLHQAGAGQLTVTGDTGVTVNASVSLLSAGQYAALSLFKLGTDDWVLVGDQQG